MAKYEPSYIISSVENLLDVVLARKIVYLGGTACPPQFVLGMRLRSVVDNVRKGKFRYALKARPPKKKKEEI